MAKEFDICLRNRVTACDVLTYFLPYRDHLNIAAGFILNANVEHCLLRMFQEAAMPMTLGSRVNKMLNRSLEQLRLGSQLGVAAPMTGTYMPRITPAALVLDAASMALLCNSITQVESGMTIDAAVQGTAKLDYLQTETALEPGSTVLETHKQSAFAAESTAEPEAALTDLLYRRYFTVSSTALELSVTVSGILKRYRLLADMDDDTLEALDSMTLGDIDYVVLEA
jgi:hypothetical protein